MKLFDLRHLLFCLLITCANTAHAVWYQVELIVFVYLSPQTDGEYWYSSPDLTQLSNTVRLRHPDLIKMIEAVQEESAPLSEIVMFPTLEGANSGDNSDGADAGTSPSEIELIPYSLLPEESKRLEGIYRVLSLSSEYKPVYHITWQQPGLDIDHTQAVHIQVEDPAALNELTIPAILVSDPMPAEFYEPIKLFIDGTIRIRSTLYLHVDLDLVLFKPPPVKQDEVTDDTFFDIDESTENVKQEVSDIPGLIMSEVISDDELLDRQEELNTVDIKVNNPVEYVRLVESRRIRLNELHYFDHPLFGAIIQVSRYGEEEQEL
jgi:hypothetical protein